MALKEFTLITPVIEAASVFKALETAIPSAVIQQVIDQINSQQQRQRKLSSELVIAMSLWSSVSMRTVIAFPIAISRSHLDLIQLILSTLCQHLLDD
jgi:hypothetical protein